MLVPNNERMMDAFITDLVKFCRAKHGRVTELSQHLGVAQPHVSAWLTGKQEPSGEHTLRIQSWLSRVKRTAVRTKATRAEVRGSTAPEEPPVWLL
jgi:DNA-binding transcriptional regulator YdaS (Cro superfamily)